MTGLSAGLASFVAETPPSDIPSQVRVRALETILDSYATALAGATEPSARTVRSSLLPVAGTGCAVVIGEPHRRVDLASAALMNGVAAHALDYDSISFAVSGFVGSATLSALAALADEGEYRGEEVLTAYCLGWEGAAALARALLPEHYAIGWHPTATMSGYAAALAACRLLRLDAERTVSAVSIVTSETSGIKIMIGNMLNGYHVGKAARNGVNAALLARGGFVGHDDPLEHVQGMLALYAGPSGADPRPALDGLGRRWDLEDPGPVFKIHACCGLVHSALDGVIELCAEHDIVADDVDEVEILVHEYVPKVMQVINPDNGYAAKFCIPYCIAAGLRDRRVRLAAFQAVDPELVELGRRVSVGVHPELTGGSTFFEREFSEVRIRARGQVFVRRVRRLNNRGSGALARQELLEKFSECLRHTNVNTSVTEDWERLLEMETTERWTLWQR